MNYKINFEEGNVFGKKGNKIGSLNKSGYLQLRDKINGERYIHRLIYKTFYQIENLRQDLTIDHINHIRNDNRIENLRLITQGLNASLQNHKNKTSKYIGVSYVKARGKWISTCNRKYLGRFKTEEEATDAYWNYYQEYVFLYSG